MSAIGSDELGYAVWTANPVKVTYTATAARSAQLTAGQMYYVVATTACYFLQGTVAVDATTSSNYLPAGASVQVRCTDATANGYVSFIRASESGDAFLMTPKAR